MRKLMLIAIASLAIAGAAIAKTVAVTITKNGYVPNAVTVAVGDTVQFTNSDTVAHQIVFKPTAGVTCVPNPLVLQPTQSGTCTFQTAGKYTYSDPNVKGNTFRGTVTVGSAPNPPRADTLTLAAKPQLVIFGGNVTLGGTLSNQKVGENVDVLAKPCGQTAPTKVTTVQTTTGGAFAAVVRPLKNTLYTVKVKNTTSKQSRRRCARSCVCASWRLAVTRCAYLLRRASPASTAPSSASTARSGAGSTSSACSCARTVRASRRRSSRRCRSAR